MGGMSPMEHLTAAGREGRDGKVAALSEFLSQRSWFLTLF